MSKAVALVVVCAGLLVMAGWVLDIGILKSILPGWVTMKFSTALSFVLSGITLFFLARIVHGENTWAQVILPITTLSILLLMATLLASTFLGMRSGVEDLFVQETGEAVKSVTPGRPSIGTMISFILMGLAGVLAMLIEDTLDRWLFVIGCLIALTGGLALCGYILDLPLLYYTLEGISTAMALHTALLFCMLGTGLIMLRRR